MSSKEWIFFHKEWLHVQTASKKIKSYKIAITKKLTYIYMNIAVQRQGKTPSLEPQTQIIYEN
jgi:hypothetical protein